MTLSLLYLKYFCDSVRLGGVTAAAKVNFVTQSAISQGITKLEKSLGCSLLARHPNRFRLTPEGQKAFQQLSEILKKTQEFQENFSEEKKNVLGNLEFASTRSFALAVIPNHLKRFRTSFPDVKVNFICSGRPDYLKQMLRSGTIDFGIAQDMGNFPGFEQIPLHQGVHGLYISNTISLEEEETMGFILPVPEDTSVFKESYFRKHQKKPQVFLEVEGWEAVARLTAEGLGIGYFPDFIAQNNMGRLRPAKLNLDLPHYNISAIYPEGVKLRKSSEIFLSYFQPPHDP